MGFNSAFKGLKNETTFCTGRPFYRVPENNLTA